MKTKYTKVWRRKSEYQKKEECESETHVHSGCLIHDTGNQIKYLLLNKDGLAKLENCYYKKSENVSYDSENMII